MVSMVSTVSMVSMKLLKPLKLLKPTYHLGKGVEEEEVRRPANIIRKSSACSWVRR